MIAILSDIHANLVAMQAVLADAAKFPVSRYFCLGDIVGYGSDSVECLDLLLKLDAACVMGNHEGLLMQYAMQPDIYDEFDDDDVIARPLELAFEKLTPAKRNWLGKLPLKRKFKSMEFVHASLFSPGEFYYIDCEEEAERNFSCQQTPVSFHGHTHVPAIWREVEGEVTGYVLPQEPFVLDLPGRYAINVGSVGQPRDDDPRASYVLYDPAKHILMPRRVAYSIPKAQKRFTKAGLPEFNSLRLETGY